VDFVSVGFELLPLKAAGAAEANQLRWSFPVLPPHPGLCHDVVPQSDSHPEGDTTPKWFSHPSTVLEMD